MSLSKARSRPLANTNRLRASASSKWWREARKLKEWPRRMSSTFKDTIPVTVLDAFPKARSSGGVCGDYFWPAVVRSRQSRRTWLSKASVLASGGPLITLGKDPKTLSGNGLSFVSSRHAPQGVLESDDNGSRRIAADSQLQIVRVLDFEVKLAKFVCQLVDKTPAPARERDVQAAANNFRAAHIQHLPGHDQAVAAWLRFDLKINLERIRAVEHVSDRGVSRPRV